MKAQGEIEVMNFDIDEDFSMMYLAQRKMKKYVQWQRKKRYVALKVSQ